MSGTLRPIEIEIEGFRSFSDKTLIKFPDVKKGSILISGKSSDGTTSSGTGKSTILMAMAYALGFCGIPSTELKSWYVKGKMSVRFRLKDDINTYDIIRDPKLKLLVNGEDVGGTSSGAQEKLEEILKASPDLVKALTYRPQREKGLFLSNTDAKNKEFLTKVLNLESLEVAGEDLAKELQSLSFEISSLTNKVTETEVLLRNGKVEDQQVAEARSMVNNTTERITALEKIASGAESLKSEIIQIDQELAKIYTANTEVSQAKQANLAIRQRVEQKQKEIEVLQNGICYTCNREWNKSQDLIRKNQEDVGQLIQSMKMNLAIIKNAEPLLDENHLKNLTDRKNSLQYEIGKAQMPLEDAKKAKNLAESNLSNLISMQNNYTNLVNRLNSTKKELKAKQIEQHIKEHCSKLLGRHGFLGSIFDEVLLEIKMRANDLILCMPNINTFSVDISSDSVTKSGKVNKKIKVSVYKDGTEKSLKTLSGGQLAAAELCVDLAVAETVRARSGSNLGWVALDEAMDGLDIETKTAALETIKTKIDGLLIVVDHSTEIKEAFDSVIEVEYDGKKSYV